MAGVHRCGRNRIDTRRHDDLPEVQPRTAGYSSEYSFTDAAYAVHHRHDEGRGTNRTRVVPRDAKGLEHSVHFQECEVPAFSAQVDFAPSTNTGVFVITNAAADQGETPIVDVQLTAYKVLQILNGLLPTGGGPSGDQP